MTTETQAPDPAPLSATVATALRRAFNLGQTYWQQADSDSFSQNAKSDITRGKFIELLEETTAAVAAIPAPEGAQALTETQIERAWRLGFRHACDAERLNSDEEWGYKGANVIEEVQALAAPAPQAPVALSEWDVSILIAENPRERELVRAAIAEFCRINGIPAPQTKEPKA